MDDGRLDHNISRTADHEQMFDIIAAHDHQLPLSIDLEGIHHPEPLLTAAATRQLDSTTENQPEQDEHERHVAVDWARVAMGTGVLLLAVVAFVFILCCSRIGELAIRP